MRLALLIAVTVLASGCGGDDDTDTLEPLPIEGGSIAVTPTSGSPGTSASSSPESAPTTSTSAVAPVGDWDGAEFDAGTIATVTELAGYRAIGFDRYSFADPERGVIDAPAFEDEPIAAWWRESPYTNVRIQLRTFVLDPDVEVLVLDERDRRQACADPPPASPPAPSWEEADVSRLDDPAAAIATLTYSPTGQVTRIRFTEGC